MRNTCATGLAALLLSLLAGPAARGAAPAKLPADLALLPAKVMGLASFRPVALIRHPARKGLRLHSHRDFLADLESDHFLGGPPAEVERATLVLVTEKDQALVVRTRKPYDRANVLKTFGTDIVKRTIRGKTVYVAPGTNAAWL